MVSLAFHLYTSLVLICLFLFMDYLCTLWDSTAKYYSPISICLIIFNLFLHGSFELWQSDSFIAFHKNITSGSEEASIVVSSICTLSAIDSQIALKATYS